MVRSAQAYYLGPKEDQQNQYKSLKAKAKKEIVEKYSLYLINEHILQYIYFRYVDKYS